MKNRVIALVAACALASGAAQTLLAQSASITGTAKNEAQTPYTDYTVRARDVAQGSVGATVALDQQGNFLLPNLGTTKYLVELVDHNSKVVCTEGPFDLAKEPAKAGVTIDCNKKPVAWWLLGAAAAAGITAGVVTGGPASAAQ